MPDMDRRRILQGALGVGALGTLAGPRAALAGEGNHAYRWDLINVLSGCIEAGGHASSKARDGARITVTGSGTFRDNPGKAQDVTGGGTWDITPGTATPAGSGTYEVTRFISFDLPPGGNVGGCDNIGELDDRVRAGSRWPSPTTTVARVFWKSAAGRWDRRTPSSRASRPRRAT